MTRDSFQDGRQKRVSVVIPSLNSAVINRTIASLKEQTFGLDQLEVLVVGLDDAGLIDPADGIRFIPTGAPVNPAVARNIGMHLAQGDFLLFLDADCIATPNWVETMVSCLAAGKAVVGGAVTFPVDNYWLVCDNVTFFHEYMPSKKAGERRYLPTLNLGVQRDVVQAVGGFDETLPRAQDIEFTVRMFASGYRPYFTPTAGVRHCPENRGLQQTLRRSFVSGEYSIGIRLRHADIYHTPFFARSAVLLLALSPLISAYIALKIFAVDRAMLRYWYTLPVVFLSKLAWCLGAAKSLLRSEHVLD